MLFRPIAVQHPFMMPPSMHDVDWFAVPRVHRPFSMFDDYAADMNHEIDSMWRQLFPQAAASARETSNNNTNNNNKGSWSEVHATFNSARDGPHFVSHRTVRVRDDSGRDEVTEERCLDGRVSKRTIKLEGNDVQQAIEGDKAQQSQHQEKEATMPESTGDVMMTGDFDTLWEQNPMVQWMTSGTRPQHKHKRQHKHQQPEVHHPQQQVEQAQAQPRSHMAELEQCDTACVVDPTAATTTTTATPPDFSVQLQTIAQLGLPCDSASYQLLQHTNGSVERTVMGILSLQRMKALGLQDDTRCVTALCKADLNLDKACELVRQEMSSL